MSFVWCKPVLELTRGSKSSLVLTMDSTGAILDPVDDGAWLTDPEGVETEGIELEAIELEAIDSDATVSVGVGTTDGCGAGGGSTTWQQLHPILAIHVLGLSMFQSIPPAVITT